MDETAIKLYCLRQLLRNPGINIEDIDQYFIFTFGNVSPSGKEYVILYTKNHYDMYDKSKIWIHNAAKKLLKLIDKNHNIIIKNRSYPYETHSLVDYQEKIEKPLFSDKSYYVDLILDPTIYNWLPQEFQTEFITNYEEEYSCQKWNMHAAAIKSNNFNLVKYTSENFEVDYFSVKLACYANDLNIVKFYLEDRNVVINKQQQKKCIVIAFRQPLVNNKKELFTYLIDRFVDTIDQSMISDLFEYINETNWRFLVSLCDNLKFDCSIPDNAFKILVPEYVQWLIQKNVKRNMGIRTSIMKKDLSTLKILLETSDENRFDLILEILKMIGDIDTSGGENNEFFDSILELLHSHNILDPKWKNKVLRSLKKNRVSRILKKTNNWMNFKLIKNFDLVLWEEFLDADTCLYAAKNFDDYDLLNQCLKFDDNFVFEFCIDSVHGFCTISKFFFAKYGPKWPEKIKKEYHHKAFFVCGETAKNFGFILYRSFITMYPPDILERLSLFVSVIEDVEPAFLRKQETIFKDIAFGDKNIGINGISSFDQSYHIRVIMNKYYPVQIDSEQFWKNYIVYDIPNAKIIDIRGGKYDDIKMEGSNNGNVDRNFTEGEHDWVDQIKSFYVTKNGFFHTARDGGSLNCYGCYSVAVKLSDA